MNGYEMYLYLRERNEDVPAWLGEFGAGSSFNSHDFFSSRVVYYPGSGTDGQPVRVFGSAHAAHCFVYADYGITQEKIENELANPLHASFGFLRYRSYFHGYHQMARIQLGEDDHLPQGWSPPHDRATAAPFGFLEVLERKQVLDDDYPVPRLAILFLGVDGVAAYDALFCQKGCNPPFALVLQDHGFGGNYDRSGQADRFGRGGQLQQIAMDRHALPEWLLVAENTEPWEGYERVPDLGGDPGGMKDHVRFLYRHEH